MKRLPSRITCARVCTLLAALLVGLALAGFGIRRISRAGRDDPQKLWQEAQAALASGQLEQAEARLTDLARRRPATLADRLLRAEVARQRGRFDQALAALEGFPDSQPGAALIWRTRGMLELERDHAQPAETALLHALALDPKLAEARLDLVKLYALQSRRRDLSEQFRILAPKSALTFDDLYLWCLGRLLNVGPAEIARKLQRMCENDNLDRPSHLALAENFRLLGRLDEAEKALAALPGLDPDARVARATLALERGDVADAGRLLADAPLEHPASARLRGRLALARGDAAGAASHYRRALAADPDDRDTLFGLAQAVRLAGKSEAAEPYLEAARARARLESLIENTRSLTQREDPKTLRAIGDACRSLGRVAEALAWYRLALARDPLDPELQKRLFEQPH
jgi:tetratricopeptide (TPR) repeat protein